MAAPHNALPFVDFIPSQRSLTPFVNQQAIIHGADYNPDQWLPVAPNILDEDAQVMQQTGINSCSVAIFAWGALEPSEGVFTFDWLDRVFEKQASIGNRVILATPTGSMPAWLAEKYPDARRVDARGLRAHYGHRHNHCWTSPSFHERARIINTKLAERYGKHPALAMWHISNELNGQCFCDSCREAWCKWLEERYGTLERMNEAHWNAFWSHQATEWRHAEPTDTMVDGRAVDWMRFNTQQLINWYNFEAETLRPLSPGVPITTNFMGTFYGVNYQAVGRVVDVITDDLYPTYIPDDPDFAMRAAHISLREDLYRCMKPGRSFMLMESCPGSPQHRTPQRAKRPGVHRLEMLQAIAHGADGTCYFQFRSGRGSFEKLHGSVIEHWGAERHTQTRRFAELRALSDAYAKLTPVLGTSVRPQVAVVYDWESRWGQQNTSGTGIAPGEDTRLVNRNYFDEIATEQYEPFWSRGIPVDVISNDRDLSGYKIVVLPMHWMMTPQFAGRLRDFVQGGGTLVATWDTAMADEFNRMLMGGWPGEGLGEVFGLWVEEMDRLGVGTPRAIKGLPGAGGDVAAIAHLTGATAIATYDEDFYKGGPAVTTHAFGKGRAYYIGTRLNAEARAALYSRIIRETGCRGVLDTELPPGVTVQVRGAGDAAFLFLLNFTRSAQSVSLGSLQLVDLESGEAVSGQVRLEPLGARVLQASAATGK